MIRSSVSTGLIWHIFETLGKQKLLMEKALHFLSKRSFRILEAAKRGWVCLAETDLIYISESSSSLGILEKHFAFKKKDS